MDFSWSPTDGKWIGCRRGLQRVDWKTRVNGWLVASVIGLVSLLSNASVAEDNRDPTVGAAGWVEQIKLPGTELVAKALDERSPIVVRVVKVFPHGDSFRYDLQFHGLEPGKYNLTDWLKRKDGSSTEGLPEIPVEVISLLPPGQVEPNGLELGWLPRLGGYRRVATVVAILWGLILFGLIFYRRKGPDQEVVVEQQRTLADLLHDRLEAAVQNKMLSSDYAELERMLLAFWRKRLGYESVPVQTAIVKIHEDPEAGPLLKQIEQWMHSPNPDKNVDLRKLVEPLRHFPADSPEFHS